MSCLPSLVYATNIPNESINMRSFGTCSARIHTLLCCPSFGEQEKSRIIFRACSAGDLCYIIFLIRLILFADNSLYFIIFASVWDVGVVLNGLWVGVDC